MARVIPTKLKPAKPPLPQPKSTTPLLFAVASGLFFLVVFCKLGDPVILDSVIPPPEDLKHAYYESWPTLWGYWMLFPLLLIGLIAIPWKQLKFKWIFALPALWLAWEFIAATQTVDMSLTGQTLAHFTVCVVLFYLGYLAFQGAAPSWPLWAGISLALCWVIRNGVEQHFGGLEATRKLIESGTSGLGIPPDALKNPEFIKRIESKRIYSTFVYANAFAGGLLLTLPLAMAFMWRLTAKVRPPMRVGMVLLFGLIGLACLYWSGSKAGWLVALAVGLVALWHSNVPFKWKKALIVGVLILGLAGFVAKYAGFFQKERNSVGARFAYWRVAMMVIKNHPILGSGPGTFQIPYREFKRPDDEPTKLCHNDYLEQASDSGILGCGIYCFGIIAALFTLYRYSSAQKPLDWLAFSVFLGVLAVCLQSSVEFHLYIPALAWTEFFLLGWLCSRLN
ncbi:MAG TPA: O-antigen ligase family protein [Verrucomicrobiae bacterium]|jgi:hypothetical protein